MDPNNPGESSLRECGRSRFTPGAALAVTGQRLVQVDRTAARWKCLEGHGLPHSPVGRIAVRVAKKDSNRVYAWRLKTGDGVPQPNSPGQLGQLWRSDDGGRTGRWSTPTASCVRTHALLHAHETTGQRERSVFLLGVIFANSGWRPYAHQDAPPILAAIITKCGLIRPMGIAWRWSTMAA